MVNPAIHILIIDDNPEDVEMYRELLQEDQSIRYQFSLADTAQEALKKYKEEPVNCILLDYNLPDMDGLEFLSALGEDVRQIAIIMLTGMGNEALAVKAMKQGVQDYLVKENIDEKSLAQAIKHALEKIQLLKKLEQQSIKLEKTNQELQETVKELKNVQGQVIPPGTHAGFRRNG